MFANVPCVSVRWEFETLTCRIPLNKIKSTNRNMQLKEVHLECGLNMFVNVPQLTEVGDYEAQNLNKNE